MFNFGELFAFCDLHASRWRERGRTAFNELLLTGALPNFPNYYDRQGFPIPARDGVEPTLVWARMKQEQDYARLGWDELPDGSYLSTVWLGLDHSFVGPPLIFETMRFAAETEELRMLPGRPVHPSLDFPDPRDGEETDQLRYTTEEEALASHHEIVRRLRIRLGTDGVVRALAPRARCPPAPCGA